MQFEETPLTIQILNAIRDTKSLNLFNALIMGDSRGHDMRVKLSISRKEFYSRITKLLRVGRIKFTAGKYSITAFGRVIHETQLTLRITVESYSKLHNSDPSNSSSNEIGMESNEQVMIANHVIKR
jgi:predicted transcriptional regulator